MIVFNQRDKLQSPVDGLCFNLAADGIELRQVPLDWYFADFSRTFSGWTSTSFKYDLLVVNRTKISYDNIYSLPLVIYSLSL